MSGVDQQYIDPFAMTYEEVTKYDARTGRPYRYPVMKNVGFNKQGNLIQAPDKVSHLDWLENQVLNVIAEGRL